MAAVNSDVLARILAQVAQGVTKDKAAGIEMTPEADAAWDRIEAEVAEAKAAGHGIDVPNEWPKADDDAPQAAADAPAPDPAAPPADPAAPPVAPTPSPGMAAAPA